MPTASGDAATYIARFYRAFSHRCVASDLTLSGNSSLPRRPASDAELADFVAEQDVIYVGGGNTANMLAVWRVHGLDRLLRAAWEAGTVLAGLSAGMICWFEAYVTDSFGPLAPARDGLGLLRGSACPHYDGNPQCRPTYQALVGDGFAGGVAADNSSALHYIDDTLHEVVTSHVTAAAYRVERVDGRVVETRLPARFLGG